MTNIELKINEQRTREYQEGSTTQIWKKNIEISKLIDELKGIGEGAEERFSKQEERSKEITQMYYRKTWR